MTQQIDNGGPAFPIQPSFDPDFGDSGRYYAGSPGLSIRDWFAGQALAGYLGSVDEDVIMPSAKQNAEFAYEQADAMLAARQR